MAEEAAKPKLEKLSNPAVTAEQKRQISYATQMMMTARNYHSFLKKTQTIFQIHMRQEHSPTFDKWFICNLLYESGNLTSRSTVAFGSVREVEEKTTKTAYWKKIGDFFGNPANSYVWDEATVKFGRFFPFRFNYKVSHVQFKPFDLPEEQTTLKPVQLSRNQNSKQLILTDARPHVAALFCDYGYSRLNEFHFVAQPLVNSRSVQLTTYRKLERAMETHPAKAKSTDDKEDFEPFRVTPVEGIVYSRLLPWEQKSIEKIPIYSMHHGGIHNERSRIRGDARAAQVEDATDFYECLVSSGSW